jgi:AcrR family transcriptional regulator
VNVDVHWQGEDGVSGSSPSLAAARAADRPRRHEGTSETEAAIFEATERLLTQTPLTELSVAQIIAAAGISRATFYFYFSSKFAVLAGLVARVSEEIFDVVQPFVRCPREEDLQPQEALRQGLTAAVNLWQRHGPALRAIHEHWNATEQLRDLWTSVIARFVDAAATELESQRRAGLARYEGDSALVSSMLIWSTERCLYVAGMRVDPNLPNEQAALKALLILWCSTLYGA